MTSNNKQNQQSDKKMIETIQPTQNFYEILGVDQNSSDSCIKSAYKNLVLQHHPDKVLEKSKKSIQKFQNIQNAYSVLRDQKMKTKYDDQLRTQQRKQKIQQKNLINLLQSVLGDDSSDDEYESDQAQKLQNLMEQELSQPTQSENQKPLSALEQNIQYYYKYIKPQASNFQQDTNPSLATVNNNIFSLLKKPIQKK